MIGILIVHIQSVKIIFIRLFDERGTLYEKDRSVHSSGET